MVSIVGTTSSPAKTWLLAACVVALVASEAAGAFVGSPSLLGAAPKRLGGRQPRLTSHRAAKYTMELNKWSKKLTQNKSQGASQVHIRTPKLVLSHFDLRIFRWNFVSHPPAQTLQPDPPARDLNDTTESEPDGFVWDRPCCSPQGSSLKILTSRRSVVLWPFIPLDMSLRL